MRKKTEKTLKGSTLSLPLSLPLLLSPYHSVSLFCVFHFRVWREADGLPISRVRVKTVAAIAVGFFHFFLSLSLSLSLSLFLLFFLFLFRSLFRCVCEIMYSGEGDICEGR